jgi:sRNA-binding protein
MAELDRQVIATLELFTSTYPVFAAGKPLALGTRERLAERHPDIDLRLVKSALLKHCKRPRYLKALASDPQRYDLDGNPEGTVTEEQREKAKSDLEKHHEHEEAVLQRRLAESQRQEEAARRKAERARIQAARAMKKQRPKKAASAWAPKPRPAGGGPRQPVIIVKRRHRFPEKGDPK